MDTCVWGTQFNPRQHLCPPPASSEDGDLQLCLQGSALGPADPGETFPHQPPSALSPRSHLPWGCVISLGIGWEQVLAGPKGA